MEGLLSPLTRLYMYFYWTFITIVATVQLLFSLTIQQAVASLGFTPVPKVA